MGFIDACLACCGLRPKREGWVYAGSGIYVPGQQVGRALWSIFFGIRHVCCLLSFPSVFGTWVWGWCSCIQAWAIIHCSVDIINTSSGNEGNGAHCGNGGGVKTTQPLVHIKTLHNPHPSPPSPMPQIQANHFRKHLLRSIRHGASTSPQVEQALHLQSRRDGKARQVRGRPGRGHAERTREELVRPEGPVPGRSSPWPSFRRGPPRSNPPVQGRR